MGLKFEKGDNETIVNYNVVFLKMSFIMSVLSIFLNFSAAAVSELNVFEDGNDLLIPFCTRNRCVRAHFVGGIKILLKIELLQLNTE